MPASTSLTLSHTGTLEPFCEGIWIDTEPVRILGMFLTVSMVVLRLEDGDLLVYSPIRLTPERQAALGAIGRVAHLYAPNLHHHRWIEDWRHAFPHARVHAPVGLVRKRPDLHIDRIHAAIPEPAFTETLEEFLVEGFRLEESVLFYRPAQTLVVADLVHNVGRPDHGWTKFYTRVMGFYDRVALSRMIRWTAFSDRKAARASIEHLLALSFDRLIVGHGTPLKHQGHAALKEAFSWL